MLWQYLPLSIILLLASCIELIVAREAWKRRATNGVLAFALMNLACAVWCLGTAFELSSTDVYSINFWNKFEAVGIINLTPLWLLFTLGYTGQSRWLPRRFFALLWVIPAVCLGMVLTNDWHGLVWHNFHALATAKIPTITFDFGPFYYITAIYSYLLIMAGSVVMVIAIIRYPRVYRSQAIMMLIGILIPWTASLSYLTGLTPGIDLSPLALAITGIIFNWSISRFGFLDIIPVARDILIENMMDGLLVIDAQNRALDINPTAQKLLGTGSQPVIGQQLSEVFKHWENADKLQNAMVNEALEISSADQPTCILDLHISNLNDRRGHATGRLIVMRDVTEQKKIAQDEREQRLLAETLKDSIAALNSTLNFDEILDLILSYIERVVPHDAASIALIDEQGMVRIKRAHGYKERHLEEYVLSIHIPLSKFPNWRWMFENVKPMIVADTSLEPGWVAVPETSWIRAYAAAPISIKGKVIGVLNLDSATPGFFTNVHASRLQAFADQAAVAIEKAQLFAEAARRAELMATINQIGIALTSGRDLEKILKTMHEQVQLAAPTDVFYIALYDDKTGEISFPLWYEGQKYYQVPVRSIRQTASLTGYIIETRKTVYFEDTLAPDFKPPAPLIRSGGKPARSYISVPMLLGERVLGVISLQNYLPNVYSPDQVHMLETVATQASIAIENARLFAQMEQMATIDPVTELFNRRQLILLASREVERALRYDKNLTAMMIDIDHFKHVNDTYGHAVGDQALYAIARLCKQTMRSIDVIGRYGGDEYALFLPETDLENARQAAERLRQGVDGLEIRAANKLIHITVSIGVAALQDPHKDLEFLLACTDQALYAAKQGGRNMVKLYLMPDPQLPGLSHLNI
jgi:diguanylate cyclase (GGDEF)-like protein/PAS domain S-box-containing protein